ncbi:MAG: phosphatidylglycerophosphatase A [Deltaproteobacteria bacterium]|nr:phosphatidylglycerophosphatase A [Deltaproteobacteria bacterium]
MLEDVNALAKLLATALGAGYSPVAPGTCGTAVAVPLVWALASLPVYQFAIVAVIVTAVAIVAADAADRAWGSHDSQRIVIDEVAGYCITMIPVARDSFVTLAIGFVVFRCFDIIKPPPVRWLDQNLPGGWGVVLDDAAAGVMGAIVMWTLDRVGAFDALARL